jgi:hypothetical protein
MERTTMVPNVRADGREVRAPRKSTADPMPWVSTDARSSARRVQNDNSGGGGGGEWWWWWWW